MTMNLRGSWSAYQSDGHKVDFHDLNQNDSGKVFGKATVGGTAGDCDGVVSGNDVVLIVQWTTGPRGRMSGHLGLDNRLAGDSVDLNNPQNTATWFSDPLPAS
ncbi:hypothetical protein ACFWJ4_37480 [Kitasatospora sp. NPDC127067]|uniref:hypothetical protein n=1 Tax=Kitasatospora sp. NPDC127067 TaxID=3347126 RepID=UPI00364DFAB4